MKLDIPLIVGHRGAKASSPENTLSAIEEAHRQGATGSSSTPSSPKTACRS
jgi:glycerophosphoryl diester phosphodiesterase